MLNMEEFSKRKAVSLTIREDILGEAKALKLNASRAAEAGILDAIKSTREAEWLDANRAAIDAYNDRIDEDGPLLTSHWEE